MFKGNNENNNSLDNIANDNVKNFARSKKLPVNVIMMPVMKIEIGINTLTTNVLALSDSGLLRILKTMQYVSDILYNRKFLFFFLIP